MTCDHRATLKLATVDDTPKIPCLRNFSCFLITNHLCAAACVAMEWPPRKFHPNRHAADQKFGNQALIDNGRRNRMLRDLRALGVPMYTQQQFDDANQNYDPGVPGDYNEEIPPDKSKWRRQNLVHFDIDPHNSTSPIPTT